MERVLTMDEKIRRAEEIYARRQEGKFAQTATVNMISPIARNKKMIVKLLLQMAICLTIYLIYYLVQNGNYIFSDEIIQKTNEILSYEINLQEGYEKILKLMKGIDQSEESLDGEASNQKAEDEFLILETLESQPNETEAIEEDLFIPEDTSGLSQMRLDSIAMKEQTSFVVPLTGVITSRFGYREPTTESVPKYHTGIDIAREEGTVIIASMEGTVGLVSSEGDYGKQVRIQKGDIITLYAHCKTIYVKEGEEVEKGQAIAEVGSTGNVTGTHLHFELRYQNRVVDPEYVLEFLH